MRGIAVNVHYQPLPMLTLFKNLGYKCSRFPPAFKNYENEISLPIYPQLTLNELDHILSVVINSVEEIIY